MRFAILSLFVLPLVPAWGQANLAPTVDRFPFHLVNLAGDVIDTTGASTQFVNFSSMYPTTLNGDEVLVEDANADSAVLRMRLDTALNVRSSSIDTPATATFEVAPAHLRHVSAIYISANCFNVTEDFLDSAVLFVDAFFSRGTNTRVFKDTLLLGADLRNFRLNTIGGAQTPIAPPTNPNVKTLSSDNGRFLDLIKIPLDTSFITYHVDSVKLSVPRRRKVFIQGGTALHVDGGTRVHAISFAINYEFDVHHFDQGDPAWGASLINNVAGKTMSAIGCAVTSTAMLLNYYGVDALDGTDLTPLSLLQWLNGNNGFLTGSASIQWGAIANFSNASHNVDTTQPRLRYEGVETDLDSIEQHLSRKTPMVLRVRSRSSTSPDKVHFVVARGITPKQHPNHADSLRGTYLLSDPGGNFPTLLSYLRNGGTAVSATNPPNRFIQVQRYSVVNDPNVDLSWLTIQLHSPAELLITDPLGRRLGVDPNAAVTYDEIPQASYLLSDPLADDAGGTETTEEFKEATIIAPVDGAYLIQVIGTGSGDYRVTSSFSTSDGQRIVNLPTIIGTTTPGQVDAHPFNLNKGPEAEDPVLTAFSFAPAAVDVSTGSAMVTATFQVTDDVSGVVRADATFQSPSQAVSLTAHGALIMGAPINGTFAGTISVAQGAETGVWKVQKVVLEDAAGRTVTLSTAQLAASGFPTELTVGAAEQTVGIDIRPNEFPNVINLKSKGIVPVAILSAENFDALTVDVSTIRLAGASAKQKHKGESKAIEKDVNGDGLLDLVVQIEISELQLDKNSTQAELTAKTHGGLALRGTDSVTIVQNSSKD